MYSAIEPDVVKPLSGKIEDSVCSSRFIKTRLVGQTNYQPALDPFERPIVQYSLSLVLHSYAQLIVQRMSGCSRKEVECRKVLRPNFSDPMSSHLFCSFFPHPLRIATVGSSLFTSSSSGLIYSHDLMNIYS